MAKQLRTIAKTAQKFTLGVYTGTAVNSGIVAVTAGIELTTLASLRVSNTSEQCVEFMENMSARSFRASRDRSHHHQVSQPGSFR